MFSNQRGRAGRKNQLTVADRVQLWEYFRKTSRGLEQMFGVDLSHWAPEVAAAARGE
jgi:hypothetical protein